MEGWKGWYIYVDPSYSKILYDEQGVWTTAPTEAERTWKRWSEIDPSYSNILYDEQGVWTTAPTEAERTWKRWSEIDPSYIRNNFPGFDPKDAKTCVVKTLFSHVK